MIRQLLVLIAVLGCCWASPAEATQGEREWSGALTAGTVALPDGMSFAGGADGQFLWHSTDFWALGGAARLRGGPAGFGAAATLDARFTLDALQWIPSVAVGVGPGWASWQTSALTLSTRVEASLGWRPARDHGWVVRVAWEGASPTSDLAAPLSAWLVSLGWVSYGGHGIGLDL